DLDPASDQVILVLFGTGIHASGDTVNASVKIGGLDSEVLYAGPQGLAGLDQVNVRLSRSLIGRGEVEVNLSLNGKPANPVRIRIK
ncbi:MAG: hypothetical protein ACREAM_12675, partial [Blastocatellia bacterium]